MTGAYTSQQAPDSNVKASELSPEFKQWLLIKHFEEFYLSVAHGNKDRAWSQLIRSLVIGKHGLKYAASIGECSAVAVRLFNEEKEARKKKAGSP